MTRFYADVEKEITDFIQRCHEPTNSGNSVSTQSSIPCLSTITFDVFSLATEHLNVFTDFVYSYTSDISIDSNEIISIVSHCSELVNHISAYQSLFIEYAMDDYLLLDEHFDSIFHQTLEILYALQQLPMIDSEIYNLQRSLLLHLPSDYTNHQRSSLLLNQIALTLTEQTSRLFSSSYNFSTNENEEDENDCIISPSFLFSSSSVSIGFQQTNSELNDSYEQSRSLLQLDKINIRTTIVTHSPLTPSIQFDLTEYEQMENDLNHQHDWMILERAFLGNIISVWSNARTINPWSSETFWTLITHFKCSEMDLKYQFILIIQWCFCLLTIEALNRDWDSLFSKTLINTIMTNRWRTVCSSHHTYLTIVGHNLNQMYLRLIRIASVLQFMKALADQSSHLTSFYGKIISSNIDNLTRRIEGTFHLLILWFGQHGDTCINGNALERALVICKNDEMELSISINSLMDSLRQLKTCERALKSMSKLHSSCQTIVNETMLKLYRRLQINTTDHFCSVLPITTMDWRIGNQQTSYMIVACDKLLKPVISQCECLNIDKKVDIYERALTSFIQAWTSVLLERKYRFSDEMVSFLQKDYEYLQVFLSTNISDQETVRLLNKASSIQQVSGIIDLLRTGEKRGSHSSLSHIPNQDEWIRSRKSSSPLLEFFQYACCCQRRNRVTTGPS